MTLVEQKEMLIINVIGYYKENMMLFTSPNTSMSNDLILPYTKQSINVVDTNSCLSNQTCEQNRGTM